MDYYGYGAGSGSEGISAGAAAADCGPGCYAGFGWSWEDGVLCGRGLDVQPLEVDSEYAELVKIVPSAGAAAAVRFFVDPYRPNLIYILDRTHVRRSDDGGKTWVVDTKLEAQLTWGGKITISANDDTSGIGDHFDLILTDMQFHPSNALVRFAVGEGGAFYTNDGMSWIRLLHSGRSLVKIDQLPASTVV